MIFTSPGEVFITVKGFSIYNYGIIMALACLVGVVVSYLIYKKYNPDKDYEKILDFSAAVLIFGIIGARLYYCLLNSSYYFDNPLEVFNIRTGGLSIHGAIIAGIAVLIYYAKKYRLGVFNVLDAYACAIALSQSIGRWGNFFNSEAFGLPTDLPWKLYIPSQHRPYGMTQFEYFHPTFLYESILDLFLYFTLLMIMKKSAKQQKGKTFFSYLTLYSIIRIIVENLRVDSVLNILGIHFAHIVSFITLLVGITGIFIINRQYKFNKNR